MVISTTSAAPVARALASKAMARFPPASRSAMMPEPTTAISKAAVPSASAVRRRGRSAGITADVVDALLQRHAVQRGYFEVGEGADAVAQHPVGFREGQRHLRRRAGRRGGIGH